MAKRMRTRTPVGASGEASRGPAEKYAPPSEPEVIVHYDGAWDPPGEADFVGWGFTARGAGIDHKWKSGNAAFRVINRIMPVLGALGFKDESGKVPKLVHRSPMLPELEAAFEALKFLDGESYKGRVRLRGDGRGLIELLSAHKVPRPGTADAEVLTKLIEEVQELSTHFSGVRWEWIPRGQNQEADALARAAMEEVFQHQQLMATAIEKHRDDHPLASLVGDLMLGTLPNRLDRRPLKLDDCRCGICRRAVSADRPGA